MAWKNTSTSRGVGAAPTLTAPAWSSPSIARRPANSSRRPRRPRPRGRPAPARRPARARPCARRGHAAARAWPRPARGSASSAGLELLPDARDGEEPGRPHGRQVGDDLARVRAAGDRHRVDDRQVVVGGALGHVGAGQPGDDPRAVGEVDALLDALPTAAIWLRWAICDALRRPGRAGGVDQREDVVGLRRRASAARGRSRVRRLDAIVPGARRHDDVCSTRPAPPATRTAGSTIATRAPASRDHVGDLLGRRGQVDARTASRRASSPPGRRRGTPGRLPSISATVSPRCDAEREPARRPARRRGRAAAPRSARSRRPACGPRRGPAWSVDREAERLGERARDRARVGGGTPLHARDATGRSGLRSRAGRCRWSGRRRTARRRARSRRSRRAPSTRTGSPGRGPSRPAPRRCGRRRAAGTGTG